MRNRFFRRHFGHFWWDSLGKIKPLENLKEKYEDVDGMEDKTQSTVFFVFNNNIQNCIKLKSVGVKGKKSLSQERTLYKEQV